MTLLLRLLESTFMLLPLNYHFYFLVLCIKKIMKQNKSTPTVVLLYLPFRCYCVAAVMSLSRTGEDWVVGDRSTVLVADSRAFTWQHPRQKGTTTEYRSYQWKTSWCKLQYSIGKKIYIYIYQSLTQILKIGMGEKSNQNVSTLCYLSFNYEQLQLALLLLNSLPHIDGEYVIKLS
jgi:hypothetical protein